jgi:hypothetical protein
MTSIPREPDNDPPIDSMHVSNFESPAHKILSQEFEDVLRHNQAVIDGFNPHGEQAVAPIALDTDFAEAEHAEPQVTALMRENMLAQLGITYKWLAEDDPDNIMQETYTNGEEQIRLIHREDNEPVALHTVLRSSEDNSDIAYMQLLNNEEVERFQQRRLDIIEQAEIDYRLGSEFGLDKEFLELSGISNEDKKAMLEAYDAMQTLETGALDLSVIDSIRKSLTKAMLPGTMFMEAGSQAKMAELTQQYIEKLDTLITSHGLNRDPDAIKDVLSSEQLLRMEALNKQLKRRRIIKQIGSKAMMAIIVPISVSSGAFAGLMIDTQSTAGPIVGAAVAGAAGVILAADMKKNMNEAMRSTEQGFAPIEKSSNLYQQLDTERKIAELYMYRLNKR